jgi:hypothetical protein
VVTWPACGGTTTGALCFDAADGLAGGRWLRLLAVLFSEEQLVVLSRREVEGLCPPWCFSSSDKGLLLCVVDT